MEIYIPFEDFGYFLKEVGSPNFLNRCRPLDVVGKQVCEDRLTDWDAEAAEEKAHSENEQEI